MRNYSAQLISESKEQCTSVKFSVFSRNDQARGSLRATGRKSSNIEMQTNALLVLVFLL